MPKPLALCLEDLEPRSAPRFVRCVACAGGEPGLCIDERGAVLWESDEGATCELWVSADERLILFRRVGGGPVRVQREHRSLDVPEAKPVVLLDRDRIDVGGRALRVHVHGPAVRLHAPAPLPEPSAGGPGRAATTAALLGAALGTADCERAAVDTRASSDGPGPPLPSSPSSGPVADDVLYVPAEAGLGAQGPEPAETLDRTPDAGSESPPDAGSSADAPVDVPFDAVVDVFELTFPETVDAADDAGRIEDSRRIEVRTVPPKPPTPETGALSVTTQPPTMVYVDGRRVRGVPLYNHELTAGRHEITFLNEGAGIRHTETVTIQPGRMLRLQLTEEMLR